MLGAVGKRSGCEQTGGKLLGAAGGSAGLSSKARYGLSVVPPEFQVLPLVPRAKPWRASRGSLCSSRFLFQLYEKTILEVPKFQRQEAGAVCLLFHLGIQLHDLPKVVTLQQTQEGGVLLPFMDWSEVLRLERVVVITDSRIGESF